MTIVYSHNLFSKTKVFGGLHISWKMRECQNQRMYSLTNQKAYILLEDKIGRLLSSKRVDWKKSDHIMRSLVSKYQTEFSSSVFYIETTSPPTKGSRSVI